MRAVVLALPLTIAACATLPPGGALSGSWGGQHVGLRLDASGGTLDYDCAAGRIDQPLVTDRDGRFVVAGTHTPGHGGPDREGEVLPTHAVRFTGTVQGDRMSLTGRVDNGVLLGPYTLRRGADPLLMRCL